MRITFFGCMGSTPGEPVKNLLKREKTYAQMSNVESTLQHFKNSPTSLVDVLSITCGGYHTCMVQDTSNEYGLCTGRNNQGQLGNGTQVKLLICVCARL